MTGPAFEAFLARLYVEADLREAFLRDPEGEAGAAGLTKEECASLAGMDPVGLELAAESYGRKRAANRRRGP